MQTDSDDGSRLDATATYLAPRNELEQAIAEIWQDELGISKVGVNDNFFDLGGHSLLAIEIAARLRESLSVDVLAGDLETSPTVAALADAIAQTLVDNADGLEGN